MINTKRGIAPLVIVLIVAGVVAVGGGTTYAVVKTKAKAKVQVSASPSPSVSPEATSGKVKGTIRDLLSLGRNVMCTVNRQDATSTISGTAYLSGSNMRGDFSMKTGSSAAVDSHIIRMNNDIYVWTGTQGAKMTMANLGGNVTGQSSVNLDEKIDYSCVDWKKDDTKFVVPTNVKFTDISATINQNGTSGKIDCNVCNNVPAGSQRDQCLIAIMCKLEVQ